MQRSLEVCSNFEKGVVNCKKKLSEIWVEEEGEKKAE
jgi:hypothetical protein